MKLKDQIGNKVSDPPKGAPRRWAGLGSGFIPHAHYNDHVDIFETFPPVSLLLLSMGVDEGDRTD